MNANGFSYEILFINDGSPGGESNIIAILSEAIFQSVDRIRIEK